MFDFLKRSRLIRRGLASRKLRRRRIRNETLRSLEYSPLIKILIFAAFIAGLAFDAVHLDEAKVGIIVGSAVSALLGVLLLRRFLPPPAV